MLTLRLAFACLVALAVPAAGRAAPPAKFFAAHCHACHDADTKKGGLDLTALAFDPADAENVARWVKVHDRILAGEMPPKNKPRPDAADIAAATKSLHDDLVAAERKATTADGKTRLRRLTRGEYENTVRDPGPAHLNQGLFEGFAVPVSSSHLENSDDAHDPLETEVVFKAI